LIRHFQDFVAELLCAGFSMAGGSTHGIYSVIPFGWEAAPREDSPIRWHTGDRETDTWQWRMRVLEDRDDIAYAKLFFGTGGYITKEWYPLFLSARRQGLTFDEAWEDGTISFEERIVYESISSYGSVPMHELSRRCKVRGITGAQAERALIALQRNMFVTICGSACKKNRFGEAYGWPSAVYCTAETFWGQAVFDRADEIEPEEAAQLLKKQILRLNPRAEEKNIRKFIFG